MHRTQEIPRVLYQGTRSHTASPALEKFGEPPELREASAKENLKRSSGGAPAAELPQRYEFQEQLGEGTFGHVRLARHLATGEQVAVKTLQKAKMGGCAEERERVLTEMRILRRLRSPFIVQLYELVETVSEYLLIMEYLGGGELFALINARGSLPESLALRFLTDILLGIAELHAAGIVWRDCKCENILIDAISGRAKLCDYGLSCQAPADSDWLATGDPHLFRTSCGSPAYAAPEIVLLATHPDQHPGYSFLVDVYSAGVVAFAMLHGRLPFEDAHTPALYKKILAGKPDFDSTRLSKDALTVLHAMLALHPRNRPAAALVLNLPWFAPERRLRRLSIAAAPLPFSATATATATATAPSHSVSLTRRIVHEVHFQDSRGRTVSRISPLVNSALLGHPSLGCNWQKLDADVLSHMPAHLHLHGQGPAAGAGGGAGASLAQLVAHNKHHPLATHYYLLLRRKRRTQAAGMAPSPPLPPPPPPPPPSAPVPVRAPPGRPRTATLAATLPTGTGRPPLHASYPAGRARPRPGQAASAQASPRQASCPAWPGQGERRPGSAPTLSVGTFVQGNLVASEVFGHSGRQLETLVRQVASGMKLTLRTTNPGGGSTKLEASTATGTLKMEVELARLGTSRTQVKFKRLLGPLRDYVDTVDRVLLRIRKLAADDSGR